MAGFDYNAYARYRQAVEAGGAPPLGPPQAPGGAPAAGPSPAGPAGPSPHGEITAGKGFMGRFAERAGIPTTAAGWSDPTRAAFGGLGALLAPRALLGEAIDTGAEAAGRPRPVGHGITTPGGSPSLSLGQMAEYGTPLRAFPVTTPGALGQAWRGGGGLREYLANVRAGIDAAGREGAPAAATAARPTPAVVRRPAVLGPGRPTFALPTAAGPSATGYSRSVPGFATESGAMGPAVPLRRRPPPPTSAASPAPVEAEGPTTYGRPVGVGAAARPDSATLGRQAMTAAESPASASAAELEPAAEFINRHRGLLNGPSLAQFVQLSNQYNRAPEPDKQRIMLAMFKLVRTAASGVPATP